MTTRHRQHVLAVAAVALASVAVASCSSAEPHRDINPDRVKPVNIGVSQNSVEQKVLAEIYAQALVNRGRSASITVFSAAGPTGQVDELVEEDSDLIIGCTGDLLAQTDPVTADEIAEKASDSANPNDVSINTEVDDALMASLPAPVTATDPSGAQGCADSEAPELPQNIVPVFTKTVFDGAERKIFDSYTKFITTELLTELVDNARESGSVSEAVAQWMSEAELSGEVETGPDNGIGLGYAERW